MATGTKGRFCHTRLTLTSSNNVLRWRDVGAATNYSATLTAGTYFLRGDNVSSDTNALDLLKELKTQMDAAASAIVFTVSYAAHTGASRGKITISGTAAFNLLWTDGAQTFAGATLGFDTSADDTGASSYTSDNHAPGAWYPETEGMMQDHNVRNVRTWQSSVSGVTDVRRLARYGLREVTYQLVERQIVKDQYDVPNVAFENLWKDVSDGGSLLWFPDVDDASLVHHCVVDDEDWGAELHNAAQPMLDAGGEVYRIRLPMRDFVAAS